LTPENAGPTQPLTRENLSWKLIEDVAGGGIQCYHQVVIDDMKAKGIHFPVGTETPDEGEFIGD
jgi:hypothetical protein